MGNKSSKSTVTTVDKQTIINKNDFNVLNQDIVSNVANTVITNAANCGASAVGSQIVSLNNLSAVGDININSRQNNKVQLNFSCTQSATVRQNIANDLYSQMMNNLKNSNSSETLGKLEANAQASMQSGFGNLGGSSSKTATDTTIDYTTINDTHTNIQNVVQKSISNNFSSNDIKTCNSMLAGNQIFAADTIAAGGNINFTVDQDQSLVAYQECKQMQETANEITGSITNALGVEIQNETETKQAVASVSSAESKNVALGIYESIGAGVAAATGGNIGNVFTGAGKGIGSVASGTGQGLGAVAKGIGSGIGDIFGSLFSTDGSVISMFCMAMLFIFTIVGYFIYNKEKQAGNI